MTTSAERTARSDSSPRKSSSFPTLGYAVAHLTLLRSTCAALGLLLALDPSGLRAQAPITLPGDKVFPENISSDAAGNIYVGNLGTGGVFRVRPNGTVAQSWIAPGAYGTNAVLGVLADERSNTLWVCSNSMLEVGIDIPKGDSASTLKGFDLETGRGKISAVLPTSPSFCNDIAIGPDGAAYVSNSSSAEILRLRPTARRSRSGSAIPALSPRAGPGSTALPSATMAACTSTATIRATSTGSP